MFSTPQLLYMMECEGQLDTSLGKRNAVINELRYNPNLTEELLIQTAHDHDIYDEYEIEILKERLL